MSNVKKFYKYLKNLQIFSLNITMCSEIVFSLCTKLLEFKRNCPLRTGVFNPRPAGRMRPSGEFCAARKGISQNTMRYMIIEA